MSHDALTFVAERFSVTFCSPVLRGSDVRTKAHQASLAFLQSVSDFYSKVRDCGRGRCDGVVLHYKLKGLATFHGDWHLFLACNFASAVPALNTRILLVAALRISCGIVQGMLKHMNVLPAGRVRRAFLT